MSNEKRPRKYVDAILESKDRNERRRMLYAVPEKYKVWVKDQVENYFAIRKHLNRSKKQG